MGREIGYNRAMKPASPPPHNDGKAVRFGCGALLGLVVGVGGAIRFSSSSALLPVLSILATALIFGLLSARHGDRFWENLSRTLRWW